MVEEFKKFLMRGPVLDLAVGVIIGAAFGAIVNSLVNDILMPPIGLVLGSVDFKDLFLVLKAGEVAGPYANLAAAKEAGAVTVNYGLFINSFVSFLIIGFSIFMVIKAVNRLQPLTLAPPAPPTKECSFCCSKIHPAATRCPQCTSQLTVA